MNRRVRIAVVAAALVAGIGLPLLPAAAADAGAISGTAFEDANRNGVLDPGEAPRAGDALWLFDGSGTCVANTTTGADGRYSFADVPIGSYRVSYTSSAWWSIRHDWVPTTTGSPAPSRTATAPSAAVDFGWRPIVRSTNVSAPVTAYTGPDGLRVRSYDDVVPARDLYDAVLRGNVGAEAPNTLVLFDYGSSSTTTWSIGQTDGVYDSFRASSYVTYESWLDGGDQTLAHEYGHAWTLYRAYVVQQDPSLSGYMAARGLTGDSRVGSSYQWQPTEMIAEDYRQLLGSSDAAAGPQMNQSLPPAAAVPGLRDYLLGLFSGAQASTSPSPSPTPATDPSPSPSPSPTVAGPSPSPTSLSSPSPSPTATSATTSPSPSPSPTSTATKAKGGCKRC